eukprot:UN22487
MAVGHGETLATGLKVWDMSSFDHPGGFPIDTVQRQKCNKIHCSWDEDGPRHPEFASNTQQLYQQLELNGAVWVGHLASMNCDGTTTGDVFSYRLIHQAADT